MIVGRRVLGLVPARGGSKGLPRKNLRPLLGKPLIVWTIEQALACRELDAVVVTTEDAEIAAVAAAAKAEVPFVRPAELASDTASSIEVVLHALDALAGQGRGFDIVALLEPTSPLRQVSDISGSLALLAARPDIDSVVGVARAESRHPAYLYRIEQDRLAPYSGVAPDGLRRQDLETLYFLEGSLYVSTVAGLREHRSFYHDRTAPWPVARYQAMEIDELSDLIAVEALLAARREGRL